MPQYLYQVAYTAESLAAQIKNPQDRLELVCEAWLGPHQRLGLLYRNHLAAAGADGSLQPMLATLRIRTDSYSRWPGSA